MRSNPSRYMVLKLSSNKKALHKISGLNFVALTKKTKLATYNSKLFLTRDNLFPELVSWRTQNVKSKS